MNPKGIENLKEEEMQLNPRLGFQFHLKLPTYYYYYCYLNVLFVPGLVGWDRVSLIPTECKSWSGSMSACGP